VLPSDLDPGVRSTALTPNALCEIAPVFSLVRFPDRMPRRVEDGLESNVH